MQTLTIIIGLLLIHLNQYCILSKNTRLIEIEENILYSNLKNQSNLRHFYEKLIQSNDVEHLERIRTPLTQEDFQQTNIEDKCFQSSNDLLTSFGIHNEELTRIDLIKLFPSLIYTKLSEGCKSLLATTKWKNFIIGLICITVINLTALFGAIILPFRNKSVFRWILSAFIGLAVGTLTGTGIFHLIPMAFDVESFDHHMSYLNKGLLAIIIIYLFYIRDQLCGLFFQIDTIVSTHNHGEQDEGEDQSSIQPANNRNLKENLSRMKPIGWMILISDLLHGFIDGLTIGAIAMVSIGECIRMTIPIACEDFSHKLGDAAVLLSSGLPIKQALFMNFLSSCGCYPGFLLGAKLGEMENFHPWICALAGGMFVYIGLADMVPELISMGKEIEHDYLKVKKPVTKCLKFKIFLTQNFGVFTGIAAMYLLAKYGDVLSQYF